MDKNSNYGHNMLSYKKKFIEFAIEKNILRFGEYSLKSGRRSPYFFNAGLFNDAYSIKKLGEFYAQALVQNNVEFDFLFGPAYKGIALVIATSIALFTNHNINVAWAFNRKEVKKHGEGGHIVGSSLFGKGVVLDDVISAGTAIREVLPLLTEQNVKTEAILISLDRQEKGQGERSAVDEIRQDLLIPVFSIITFEDLMSYVKDSGKFKKIYPAICEYREKYGIVV